MASRDCLAAGQIMGISHKVRSTLTQLLDSGDDPISKAAVQKLATEVLELAEAIERLSIEVDRSRRWSGSLRRRPSQELGAPGPMVASPCRRATRQTSTTRRELRVERGVVPDDGRPPPHTCGRGSFRYRARRSMPSTCSSQALTYE